MLYCTFESYAKFSRLTLHNNQSQEFAYQKRKRYVKKFLGFCQFQYRIYINVIATICLKSRTIVKVWHVRSHPTFEKKGKHLYTHTFKLKKEVFNAIAFSYSKWYILSNITTLSKATFHEWYFNHPLKKKHVKMYYVCFRLGNTKKTFMYVTIKKKIATLIMSQINLRQKVF